MTSKMKQLSALIALLLLSNGVFVFLYLKKAQEPAKALSIQLESANVPAPPQESLSPLAAVVKKRVLPDTPVPSAPVAVSPAQRVAPQVAAPVRASVSSKKQIANTKVLRTMKSLDIGRKVIQDFEKRFFQYSNFFNEGNFLAFFQSQTNNYLLNHQIRVYRWQTEQNDFKLFHQEVVQWILSLEPKEIQSTARYIAFSLNEPFFQIPLSSLASELIPELSAIDFSVPVLLDDVEIAPKRNKNGELIHNRPVFLEQYNSAQQFFYRRGPLLSEKVSLFLKAYLFHSNS